MPTVFANGRSIAHKGDGQNNIAAPPDACKTPTPGGPVPIPYVNMALSKDLIEGTKTVQIEGNPVAKADSNLCTSTGDEPGTAGGGLMSAKTKGKLTWATYSSDVLFEGQGVVRFMDVAQHNGNSFNTAFIKDGGTGLAYGDDFEGPCPICKKSPDKHKILETRTLAGVGAKLIQRLLQSHYPHGFMVAVATCKCNKLIIGTSGNTPEDFTEIAKSAGATLVVPAMALKAAKDLSANLPHLASGSAQKTLAETWARLKTASRRGPGYPTPGNCAAQKVAATGHVIVAMSEMMYSPLTMDRWKKTVPLSIIVDGYKTKTDFASRAAGLLDEPKGAASCLTCQTLLPLLLCDKERAC